MTERDKLLGRVRMYDFALLDVGLFLDSHPMSKEALEYYRKYSNLSEIARNEYTEKYGPLTKSDVGNASRWTWVDDPWPWERGE